MSQRSRRYWLGVGALLIGVITNIALLRLTPDGGMPFRSHDNASLLELVETEQLSLALDHAFYLELRAVGAGLTLVAEDGLLDPVSVDGLADMTLAIAGPLEPVEASAISALEGRVGSVRPTDDADTMDYLIVEPDPDDTRMRVLVAEGTLVVVGATQFENLVTP
jgi:hypothetical protein